jgi:hypothetical protein
MRTPPKFQVPLSPALATPSAATPPWLAVIYRWRQLPLATRRAVRWSRVPRQVALSFAFERESVGEAWLAALHAQSAVAPTAGRGSSSARPRSGTTESFRPISALRLSALQVSGLRPQVST